LESAVIEGSGSRWLRRLARLRWLWIALALLASAGLFAFLAITQPPVFHDLSVYYTAATKALGHKTVYDVEGHYQFKYAPGVATLFGFALAPFPFERLSHVYYAVNLVLWLVLVQLCGRALFRLVRPGSAFSLGAAAALLLLFVVVCGVPLRDELKLGQLNVVPLGLLFVLYRGLDSPKRSRAAALWMGSALALAVSIKLYCVVAIPILLLRREWGVLLCATIAFFAINILGVAAWSGLPFALAEFSAWSRTLFASSSELLFSEYNVSLLGTVGKLSRPLAYACWAAVAIVFLLLLARFSRSRPALLQLPLVLGAIVLLNPLCWPYWSLFTFPAIFWLALRLSALSSTARVTLIAAAVPLAAIGCAQDYPFARAWATCLSSTAIFLFFSFFAFVSPGAPREAPR